MKLIPLVFLHLPSPPHHSRCARYHTFFLSRKTFRSAISPCRSKSATALISARRGKSPRRSTGQIRYKYAISRATAPDNKPALRLSFHRDNKPHTFLPDDRPSSKAPFSTSRRHKIPYSAQYKAYSAFHQHNIVLRLKPNLGQDQISEKKRKQSDR